MMASTSEEPIYLTTEELANRWRVSTSSVSKWRVQGKPPIFFQINGTILYKLADIKDLEKANRKSSTSN